MAVVVCIPPIPLPDLMSVTMPGMGELTFLRDSLDKAPRPSELILKALNNLAPALAPIYGFLRILDVNIALFNCTQAMKKAVLQLSPKPIIDCLPKLVKAVTALAPLIPPLSYVTMVVDMVTMARALVADMLSYIAELDAQITAINQMYLDAQTNNDNALLVIANCAKASINAESEGIMQIMVVIGKVTAVMLQTLDVISSTLPGPASKKVDEIKKQLTGVQATATGVTLTDFPPLGQMQQVLVLLHTILTYIEAAGNAVLARSFEAQELILAPLVNP